MSKTTPLVSVIINNFNYARYIGQAIHSVLWQTFDNIELIIVDDGSTDDSPMMLAPFRDRAVIIFKDNGGQASALNAGFARATGSIVIFLDADDMLCATVIERVVVAVAHQPDFARVHYPMAVVDAAGAATGEMIPRAPQILPVGDLRRHILAFPDDLPFVPMSGNAFSMPVLRKIMPIPENEYGVILADLYLLAVSPLFGPIITLDTVGACYRVHGRNHFYHRGLDIERTRQLLTRTHASHIHIIRFANEQRLPGLEVDQTDLLSVTYIANRMLSYRFDRFRHPFPEDSRVQLLRMGMTAADRRFDLRRLKRYLYAIWFLAVGIAPAAIARRIATFTFDANRQPRRGIRLTSVIRRTKNKARPSGSGE